MSFAALPTFTPRGTGGLCAVGASSLLLIWLVLALPCPAAAQATSPASGSAAPRIAAAADLRGALDEVAASFARDQGVQVSLIFGSSGVLARQIVDGAPFEVFLSADERYVEQVVSAGRTVDGGVLYATGRLVLYAPRGSPLEVDAGLSGLRRSVASGRMGKFAIANPAHAPYGRAAEAVLRAHDLWTGIQPSLVLADNVSQAAQFAASGNVVGALLAFSLVKAAPLSTGGSFVLIPESAHPPLRQRMVLLRGASDGATRFFAYLQGPRARALLASHGFSLPAR